MTKNRMPIAVGALACLSTLYLAAALPIPASEPQEPPEKKADPRKSESKKNGEPASESPVVSLRIRVDAEGMPELPHQSSIELKGDDTSCGDLERTGRMDKAGKVTFSGLPVCRVLVKILITGFETKKASLDVATYKNSEVRIHVRPNGPPTLE